MNLEIISIIIIDTVAQVVSYPRYIQNIPNGNNIHDPCDRGNLWPGIGHIRREGGGPRNDFGTHFAHFGRTWNEQLCRTDSDKDGLSNGAELGVPDCRRPNSIAQGMIITHPGFCNFCDGQRILGCINNGTTLTAGQNDIARNFQQQQQLLVQQQQQQQRQQQQQQQRQQQLLQQQQGTLSQHGNPTIPVQNIVQGRQTGAPHFRTEAERIQFMRQQQQIQQQLQQDISQNPLRIRQEGGQPRFNLIQQSGTQSTRSQNALPSSSDGTQISTGSQLGLQQQQLNLLEQQRRQQQQQIRHLQQQQQQQGQQIPQRQRALMQQFQQNLQNQFNQRSGLPAPSQSSQSRQLQGIGSPSVPIALGSSSLQQQSTIQGSTGTQGLSIQINQQPLTGQQQSLSIQQPVNGVLQQTFTGNQQQQLPLPPPPINAQSQSGSFQCSGTTNSDTASWTLQLPKARVPIDEDAYICSEYDFTVPGDFHMIAVESLIDNPAVLSAMKLFACDQDITTPQINYPYYCNPMPKSKCRNVLSVYTRANPGTCYPDNAGIKIGRNGYKRFILQLHWINKDKRPGLTDSSGVKLYYTNKLRQYDAGTILLQSVGFTIPKAIPNHTVSSNCPKECTLQQIKSPAAYVFQAYHQMNKYGRMEKLELFRSGRIVDFITNDDRYDYRNPTAIRYQPPKKILPGDDLRLSCVFDSTTANSTVRSGTSNKDETCVAFLLYYPKSNWDSSSCETFQDFDMCKLDIPRMNLNGCDYTGLLNTLQYDAVSATMLANCTSQCTCSPGCNTITNYAKNHPCFTGNFIEIHNYRLAHNLGSSDRLSDLLKSMDLCSNPNSLKECKAAISG